MRAALFAAGFCLFGCGDTGSSPVSTQAGSAGETTASAGGGNGGAAGNAGTANSGGISGAGTGGTGNADSGGAAGDEAGGDGGTAGIPGLPPVGTSDKLDLLLMVDNSISMADKQELLREAVPMLVQRLIEPRCVDELGVPTGGSADASGSCSRGMPEILPLKDIHIGIITSSLGAHGGQTCSELDDDDKGRLVTTMRPSATPAVATWNDSGFLAWDPDATRPRNDPPGERSATSLMTSFRNMLALPTDQGCGYEASLEAWYRFLIDPEPPSSVRLATDPSGNPLETEAIFDPPDTTLLAQRAAFLRPDSTVAIVMLTDENDCSVRDDGQAYLVGLRTLPLNSSTPYYLPRATSVCATNPDSECCLSCNANPLAVPPACGDLGQDSECLKPRYTNLEDSANLRCFDHKGRFGFDLLYPIQRYVDGLTSPTVPSRRLDATGRPIQVPNPLYAGTPQRSPSQVFLAGIVGVPWQDVASEASLNGPALEYLSYEELTEQDRWSLMLGSPGNATTPRTRPRDGLMLETTEDRSTLGLPPHPLIGAAIAPPTAAANANPINGHESAIADSSDLQFACTFPLREPRRCLDDDVACDCKPSDAQYMRSICDGTTQIGGKAYPSVRHLEVLKALGERTSNAVVASICPKTLDPADPSYGYAPAIAALIERMKSALIRPQ